MEQKKVRKVRDFLHDYVSDLHGIFINQESNKVRPRTIGYLSMILILLLIAGIVIRDLYWIPKNEQTVHAQVPDEEEGKKSNPLLKMPPLVILPSLITQQPENATPSAIQGEEATKTNETPSAIEESQPTQKPEVNETPSAIQETQPTKVPETNESLITQSFRPVQGPQQPQGPPSPKEPEVKKAKAKKKKKKRITIEVIRDSNMYEGSTDSAKVIQKLKAGSVLTVIDSDRGYLKAIYKTKKGKKKVGYVDYLYTTYLEKAKKKISFQTWKHTKGTVNASHVNFRTKPGITSQVKKTENTGKIVKVIGYVAILEGEDHGWYLVQDESTGEKSCVYGKYLDIYIEIDLTEKVDSKKEDSKKEDSKKKDSKKEDSKKEDSKKKDSKKETSKEVEDKKEKDEVTESKGVFATEKEEESNKKEDKKEDKKENNKKKETKKKKSPKPYSDKLKPTEANVDLLAKIMDAETGYRVEKAKVGQTVINKAVKFKTTLRKILTARNQYPTTRRKIDAGQIKPRKSTKKLAKQLLSREKNGFEGTDVPKSLWNKVMYQASDDPSKWSEPVTVVSISQHYYALDYLMKKNGKPVYHLNKRKKVR